MLLDDPQGATNYASIRREKNQESIEHDYHQTQICYILLRMHMATQASQDLLTQNHSYLPLQEYQVSTIFQ